MDDRLKWKLLRVEKHIKIVDLKKILGCSQPLISMYEGGQTGMSQERVQAYKDYIENA